MNFFKKIDGFLNACVDYFDYRILTGKFIGDIKYNISLLTNLVAQTWEKEYNTAAKSNLFLLLLPSQKLFGRL